MIELLSYKFIKKLTNAKISKILKIDFEGEFFFRAKEDHISEII